MEVRWELEVGHVPELGDDKHNEIGRRQVVDEVQQLHVLDVAPVCIVAGCTHGTQSLAHTTCCTCSEEVGARYSELGRAAELVFYTNLV